MSLIKSIWKGDTWDKPMNQNFNAYYIVTFTLIAGIVKGLQTVIDGVTDVSCKVTDTRNPLNPPKNPYNGRNSRTPNRSGLRDF